MWSPNTLAPSQAWIAAPVPEELELSLSENSTRRMVSDWLSETIELKIAPVSVRSVISTAPSETAAKKWDSLS